MTHDEQGRQIGAEAFDLRQDGALTVQNILLHRLVDNPEVEEMTRDQFVEWSRKT